MNEPTYYPPESVTQYLNRTQHTAERSLAWYTEQLALLEGELCLSAWLGGYLFAVSASSAVILPGHRVTQESDET